MIFGTHGIQVRSERSQLQPGRHEPAAPKRTWLLPRKGKFFDSSAIQAPVRLLLGPYNRGYSWRACECEGDCEGTSSGGMHCAVAQLCASSLTLSALLLPFALWHIRAKQVKDDEFPARFGISGYFLMASRPSQVRNFRFCPVLFFSTFLAAVWNGSDIGLLWGKRSFG